MLWLHCMLAYGKGSGSRHMLCAVLTACMPGRPLAQLDLSTFRMPRKILAISDTKHLLNASLCCAVPSAGSCQILSCAQCLMERLCFRVPCWQSIVPGMYVCTPVPGVFLCSDVYYVLLLCWVASRCCTSEGALCSSQHTAEYPARGTCRLPKRGCVLFV
jgi:hypothetical protein